MTTPDGTDIFYGAIPVFRGFGSLMDPALYSPLPDDWTVGVADIVESTKAIANQRYKAVNMAGAAVIAAVTNALEGREFPFVFGGDGASFAVSPADLDARARGAGGDRDLGRGRSRSGDAGGAGAGEGRSARRASMSASPASGRRPICPMRCFPAAGSGWADAAMKRGEFAVPAAHPGTQPDLSGLSCRFEEIPSTRGLILSVLVVPAKGADPLAFRKVIEDIIQSGRTVAPDAGRPVPPGGPPLRWPPAGVEYEARAARGGPLLKRRTVVLAVTLWAYVVMRFGIKVGNFVPKNYVQQVVENSDFRKYDDGLRMILDCTEELERALAQLLAKAASERIVRYGLHRQDAAMMTCFTPSVMRSDHVHFIDGARGGYASAATALKAMAA